MKNLFRLLGAGAMIVATIAVTTTTAGAEATVDSSTTTCGTFTAAGTTTQPFYVVEVFDNVAGEDVLLGAYPADEGTFSFTLTWTPAPEAGTSLTYTVWGSPTDDTSDWDGEAYFEVDVESCVADVPPPTTPTTADPVTPTTPTTAGPAVQADAVAVTPAFTG